MKIQYAENMKNLRISNIVLNPLFIIINQIESFGDSNFGFMKRKKRLKTFLEIFSSVSNIKTYQSISNVINVQYKIILSIYIAITMRNIMIS